MSKVCCLQKRFAADVLSAPLNPEALREPLICPPGQYHDALQKKDERIKLRQWPYLQCHEPPPELHQPFSDVSLGSFRCLWLDWRSGVLRKKWKDRNDIKICFQFNLVCAVSLDLGIQKSNCHENVLASTIILIQHVSCDWAGRYKTLSKTNASSSCVINLQGSFLHRRPLDISQTKLMNDIKRETSFFGNRHYYCYHCCL